MPEMMPFAAWVLELKTQGVEMGFFTTESAETIDAEAFRMYYDDGMTPRQAILEDLSYA